MILDWMDGSRDRGGPGVRINWAAPSLIDVAAAGDAQAMRSLQRVGDDAGALGEQSHHLLVKPVV